MSKSGKSRGGDALNTSMIRLILSAFVAANFALGAAEPPSTPNVVIVFMDDMGYADVSSFGAKDYSTPNIDSLAKSGRKFTHFHVAQAVCSASRAALMTGCYPNRIGIHGALGPQSKVGIHSREMTLAELVKQKGYATCAVGKWHLGHLKPFLPKQHGFDHYYGLPYSNDMWPYHPEMKKGKKGFPELPLIHENEVLDADVNHEEQTHLTTDYTTRAVDFIEQSKGSPFFLYLAHSMVHVPLFVSEKFKGKSGKGLFADVMLEVDWSVGQVLETLRKNNLEKNTLIIFTSDNGPWLSYGDHAGSAAPLREGKGTSWEGGTRVSCLMSWPGKIPAGSVCDTPLMTIDILPTLAHLIGGKLPDHQIDGLNVWPVISGEGDVTNPHEFYANYYADNQLQAITAGDGRWKLYLPHGYRTLAGKPGGTGGIPVAYEGAKVTAPELYDLKSDISETQNVANQNPDQVQRLLGYADQIRAELGDKLTGQKGSAVRDAGQVE
jgi:arylsulfatase A-like enzyme